MNCSALVLLFAALSPVLNAQANPPSFRAEDVRPHGAAKPHPLVPGLLVWIFGHDLGRPCGVENPMDPATYRTELCGTRVLVDGQETRLIFVSEGQINLRLPDGPWENQNVGFQILRDGVASAVVPVPFGSQRPVISLPEPAYAGLPVWLRVEKPWGTGWLRYPFHTEPWDFGSACFEVQFEGKTVPPVAALPFAWPCLPAGGGSVGLPAEPTEKYLNRVPLHLAFQIDRPGEYRIRYREYRLSPTGENVVALESAWTALTVRAAEGAARQAWLDTLTRTAPQGVVELLCDFLPSLLASHEEQALRLLAPYLDHKDSLVRAYAGYALYYFDEATRKRVVPGQEPPRGFVR